MYLLLSSARINSHSLKTTMPHVVIFDSTGQQFIGVYAPFHAARGIDLKKHIQTLTGIDAAKVTVVKPGREGGDPDVAITDDESLRDLSEVKLDTGYQMAHFSLYGR